MLEGRPHGRLKDSLVEAVRDGVRSGLRTAAWLLSIMLPVSLLVFLLGQIGVVSAISAALEPAFRLLSLPGSTALVFLTGIFVNLYSAIAVIGELGLSVREMTIVALMGLTAHNFLVEIAVLKSTGSSAIRMVALRLLAALIAGYVLGVVLPAELADRSPAFGEIEVSAPDSGAPAAQTPTFGRRLGRWAVDSLTLTVRISAIVLALMIGERILQAIGAIRAIGRRLGPLMTVFGLPPECAFLWFVSNTLGLAYGAGILRREVAEGNLTMRHGDLLNHHIAVSHSLLEDTLLFAALGVPAVWIVVPRLLLAMAAVWERRLELAIRGAGAGPRGRHSRAWKTRS